MINISQGYHEGSFPLIIKPLEVEQTLAEFLHLNQSELSTCLLKHGALLFRGFKVKSAEEFAASIKALQLGEFVNYIGGDSPRDKVHQQVYTSTEAPPNLHIPLHQELSFIKRFPHHIYFYCETAAQKGGETIIGDARKIYHAIDAEVRRRFELKHLTYISRYYHQSKIMQWVNRIQRSHKSWTEVFETNHKQVVENHCNLNDFQWRWLPQDWLEIQQTRPAVLTHPITQETVWFNQAHLYDFNPRLLGWMNYIAAKLFYIQKSTRLHEISFADGGSIKRDDLYHVLDILDKHTVAYPWMSGDVMVLDNILTMHGRAPFQGKRRVLTAMTSRQS